MIVTRKDRPHTVDLPQSIPTNGGHREHSSLSSDVTYNRTALKPLSVVNGSFAAENLLPKLLPDDIFSLSSGKSGFSFSKDLHSSSRDTLRHIPKSSTSSSSSSTSTSGSSFKDAKFRGNSDATELTSNPKTNAECSGSSPSIVESQLNERNSEFPLKELDEDLSSAVADSVRTGSLIPIIKEELKTKIQYSRLMSGKEELAVNFSAPTRNRLSTEEEEKVDRRREQNRVASKKFRHRKKEQVSGLAEKIQRLEAEYSRLESEAERLRSEKTLLGGLFMKHIAVCPVIKVLMDNVDISDLQPHVT